MIDDLQLTWQFSTFPPHVDEIVSDTFCADVIDSIRRTTAELKMEMSKIDCSMSLKLEKLSELDYLNEKIAN